MDGASTDATSDTDWGAALARVNDLSATTRRCAMGKLLDDAPDEFRALLEDRMAIDGISSRRIHEELSIAGIRVGRDTLSLHRANRCICMGDK
jgi:hypothetical protein